MQLIFIFKICIYKNALQVNHYKGLFGYRLFLKIENTVEK